MESLFLKDKNLELRLKHCKELPSPPGVAIRILEICQDPVADFSMVAETVSLDPALASKILRIANSAMYARQRNIDNLRQAIMVLGLNGTLVLSLSFSLVSSLKGKSSATGLDYNHFWRRSLEAACACRQLGLMLGYTKAEDLFLAGLLSDIGVLALDKVIPDLYETDPDTVLTHQLLTGIEKTRLGIDHSTVGAWLLESWKLPSHWVSAVAASHDPEVNIKPEHQKLANFATVASDLADFLHCEDIKTSLAQISQRASQLLDVDHSLLSAVIEATACEVKEIACLFNIDLGDQILMDSLLEEAKELLVTQSLNKQDSANPQLQAMHTLQSQNRELQYENTHDVLTRIYNRSYFDPFLKKEFEVSMSRGWPMAILYIDIDKFKSINDTFGHRTGDQVLLQTAEILLDAVRDTDIVARYGGDEFLVLLPGMGADGARIVSERLLKASANNTINPDGNQTFITLSIGIAVQNEPEIFKTPEMLVHAADTALLKAKSNGRDQAAFYRAAVSA
ncbi:MAG: GGDEF domain-containing protein [Gammaproteobacteria bacterium]